MTRKQAIQFCHSQIDMANVELANLDPNDEFTPALTKHYLGVIKGSVKSIEHMNNMTKQENNS